MSELQTGALILFFFAAIPSYLLAEWILRSKRYSILAGWNESITSNRDAHAATICRGIRGFGLLMALGSVLAYFGLLGVVAFSAWIVILPTGSLIYFMVQGNTKYGASNS